MSESLDSILEGIEITFGGAIWPPDEESEAAIKEARALLREAESILGMCAAKHAGLNEHEYNDLLDCYDKLKKALTRTQE